MSTARPIETLTYQIIDSAARIMELDDMPMWEKRAALERALGTIEARRDQCWPENDDNPEDLL